MLPNRSGPTCLCSCSRRFFLVQSGVSLAGLLANPFVALARTREENFFIAEAFRMKAQAIASGDQPYGAVIVRANEIVGYGPSRVVIDRNADAHAERVAIWDAQRRMVSKDLTGAIIYSTSRPCSSCQRALALANIDRMYFGNEAMDGGKPKFN